MSDPGIERNGIAALQAREIVVDGLRMFFRASLSEVPAERPPVVLVHGLVVASDYMLPTAERLAVASMRLTSPVSAEAPNRAALSTSSS